MQAHRLVPDAVDRVGEEAHLVPIKARAVTPISAVAPQPVTIVSTARACKPVPVAHQGAAGARAGSDLEPASCCAACAASRRTPSPPRRRCRPMPGNSRTIRSQPCSLMSQIAGAGGVRGRRPQAARGSCGPRRLEGRQTRTEGDYDESSHPGRRAADRLFPACAFTPRLSRAPSALARSVQMV